MLDATGSVDEWFVEINRTVEQYTTTQIISELEDLAMGVATKGAVPPLRAVSVMKRAVALLDAAYSAGADEKATANGADTVVPGGGNEEITHERV